MPQPSDPSSNTTDSNAIESNAIESNASASTATASAASASGPDQSFTAGQAVGRAAWMLRPQTEELSSSDRAALRRLDPDMPVTPALWKVLFDLRKDEAPGWISQEKWERCWATLLMGLARCDGLHNYDVPLGQALAEAGWPETRFVHLMEAGEESLPALVRRMAGHLSKKQQPANWDDVRRLLFYQSGERAQDIRLRVARTYYRTRRAQEQSEE